MNRFEVMLAPPTLSSKDMAMHVKMQKAIPKEQANAYRAEMFMPKVRLYDELTTLRFKKPGPDESNALYTSMCRTLTSATGAPIPYRFFKIEFNALLNDLGISEEARSNLSSLNKKKVRDTVMHLSDPWRVQAYAALCARIGENSEVSDPENAASAWDLAFTLYQRFFSIAKVEDTTTYKQQTEPKLCEDTVEAWKNFRKELLAGIVGRYKDYAGSGKARSVSGCMAIFSLNSARMIDRTACEQAVTGSMLPLVNSISSAKSLKEAEKLYDNIPAQLLQQDTRQEFFRAMLGVMTAELDRLMESGSSVVSVLMLAGKLGVKKRYSDGSPLVKKAAADFYEHCGWYVREVLQKDKHSLAKYADALLSIIPDDIVVARNNDGELHREDLLGVCTANMLRDKYESSMTGSLTESQARALGKNVLDTIQSGLLEGSDKDNIRRHVTQNLLATLSRSKMSPRQELWFLDCFNDNQPIIDEGLKTVGGYKNKLSGGGISGGMAHLAEFAQADDGTRAKLTALNKVIEYALAHPEEDVNGDTYMTLADACCRNAFIGALNLKNSSSNNYILEETMSAAASFLPSDYSFPAGKQNLSLSMLEKALNLDIDQSMRRKAAALRHKSSNPIKSFKPAKPAKPVKPSRPARTPGAFGKSVMAGFKLALFLIIFLAVLRVVFTIKGLPFGAYPTRIWAYVGLLLRISIIFAFISGFSVTYSEDSRHPRFWKFVLIQSVMLYLPVTGYLTLRFFHALPLKTWVIVLYCLYGVLYFSATVSSFKR